MSKEELIQKLIAIAKDPEDDTEKNHSIADDLLIKYINDKDIENAFNAIGKWYA